MNSRFNDSDVSELKYIIDHGVRYTLNDFKIVVTNDATYSWDDSSSSYKWSGTPKFQYQIDLPNSVSKVIVIKDGVLTNTFIMDDGVHGAVEYNANMESESLITLSINNDSENFNVVYYNTSYGTFETSDGKELKVDVLLNIKFPRRGDFLFISPNINVFELNEYEAGSFSLELNAGGEYELVRGIISATLTNVYGETLVKLDGYRYGRL